MPIFPKGMITKQRLLLAYSWDKEKEALSDEETVQEDTLVCVDFKAGMGLSLPSCGFLISDGLTAQAPAPRALANRGYSL